MPFAPECFWAFQARATFWAIFEKFLLVPLLYFFRKCWFWAIRALLEPFSAPKYSPVFALEVHTNYSRKPFALECFWAFQARATFWAIFDFFFGPPFVLVEKMPVLGDLA